jgi:hypothetical protein
MASVSKEEPKVGGITLSQASYPILMSVLLTLQVATSGHEANQESVGDCKVKLRYSRDGVAWKVKYGG